MLKGQTMHVSFSAVTWRANTAQGDVAMYPEGAQGGQRLGDRGVALRPVRAQQGDLLVRKVL
jgi:hypothetical protein